jgi:dipeptide/tripeptide permease
MVAASARIGLLRVIQDGLSSLRKLRDAPRELWLVYVLKFLGSYSYFALSLILTKYLTDEYGYSDTEAGWVYGVFGLLIAIFGIILGFFIDCLGVKRSLILGNIVSLVWRLDIKNIFLHDIYHF